ncbi:MAG TPA: TonB-dependent receptor [Salinimicrobium sp.]|nr:TonB-dependent receptor [Salinimicrobium sp.]
MYRFLFILLFAVNYSLYAQENFNGQVLDSKTNEPIFGATVYLPELEKGSVTDFDGFFSLKNISKGTHFVVISALGYKTFSIKVELPIEEFEVHLDASAIEMEAVIISTPFHRLQSENVMKIERRSFEELSKHGNSNLAEGISNIPGVANVSTGAGIGKPVIRGLSGNRVLVYTQGVRLENQQFGGEHSLGVSNSGIESIEVIKGPSSLLYGSDALGGVLYINPEKYAPNDSTQIDVGLNYYSNTLGTEANVGYKTSGENLSFLIRGNYATHSDYQTGDGERVSNSRFNEMDLKTGISFQNEKLKSDLRYNFNRAETGIPEEIGEQSTSKELLEPYQETNNHILSLDNRIYLSNSSLDLKIGYTFNNRKEFESHHEHEESEEPEEHEAHGEEPALEMHLQTVTYDLKYNLPKMGNFETIVGLQGMSQENKNLAEEILIPNANMTDFGIFATSHFHLEKIDLQAGIRFDNRNLKSEMHQIEVDEIVSAIDKDFSSFNASFGAKYDITQHLSSRLNISTGFRSPNLAELTSRGNHHGANRYEIGNSNLDKEQALQIDLSLEYSDDHFEVFANAFQNRIKNFIYLNPNGEMIDENPVFQYVQDDAQLYGGEVGIHLHPHPLDWLHLRSSFEMIVGKQENENYLPLMPAHSLLNSLNLQFKKVEFLKDFYTFLDVKTTLKQDKTSDFETNTDGYTLVDLGFGGFFNLKKQKFSLKFSVNNLFDTTYISHLSRLKSEGIPNMGRNMSIGLKTVF